MISIAERQKYILSKLQKDKFIKVVDIANELGVTTITIRKDLKQLEDRNLLYRSHGSASPINPNVPDLSFQQKKEINYDEKRRIGKCATKLIEQNDSILIASGSTILAFAEQIVPQRHLNVVTTSLSVSILLNELDNVSVLQLGGTLYKNSQSVRGSYTLQAFEDFSCSKLFIGVDGIDTDFGITTSTLEEATLTKRMMECAAKTIVLADSSKFHKRGFGRICPIENIDTIVTDNKITPDIKESIEEMGVKLIIA